MVIGHNGGSGSGRPPCAPVHRTVQGRGPNQVRRLVGGLPTKSHRGTHPSDMLDRDAGCAADRGDSQAKARQGPCKTSKPQDLGAYPSNAWDIRFRYDVLRYVASPKYLPIVSQCPFQTILTRTLGPSAYRFLKKGGQTVPQSTQTSGGSRLSVPKGQTNKQKKGRQKQTKNATTKSTRQREQTWASRPQGNIRRGGRGGVKDPKVCVPKMARSDSPSCKLRFSHDGHFGLEGVRPF